mmetsp:Transcript_63414/g.145225  ORF Transcript_63414/g.145225 Transcript_63414/m.145225 type:complete len:562 (-) Transcript_63414:217-1902(-)
MYTKVSAADDLNDATDTAETKDAAPASDEKENAVAATTAEGGSNEGPAQDLEPSEGDPLSATANHNLPGAGINKFALAEFLASGGVEFTGSDREYGFVRGQQLSKEQPYFEVTIVVDREDGIGIGLCGNKVMSGAMPGWPAYPSIGYHSDDGGLFQGRNYGMPFGPPCHAGDRMGCGVLFSAGGVAETVVFTKNRELIGWVPLPASGMLFPVVASAAPAVANLDLKAELPSFPPACWVKTGTAEAIAFSNLALAVASAKDGDIVTANGGVHAFNKGLAVTRSITICGVEGKELAAEPELRGGEDFVIDSKGIKVRLKGLSIKSFGGDKSAGWEELGGAGGVCARQGSITIESCKISSQNGTGVVSTLLCQLHASHTNVGPCGRHGIVFFAQGKGGIFAPGEGSVETSRNDRGVQLLDGVTVRDCEEVGVAVNPPKGSKGSVTITGCSVEACKDGLVVHPAKVTLQSSSFVGCRRNAIKVLSWRSEGLACEVQCKECTIKDCPMGLRAEGGGGVAKIGWDNSNTIQECITSFACEEGGVIDQHTEPSGEESEYSEYSESSGG